MRKVIILLLLAGCNSAPLYTRPNQPIPWRDLPRPYSSLLDYEPVYMPEEMSRMEQRIHDELMLLEQQRQSDSLFWIQQELQELNRSDYDFSTGTWR